MVTVYYRAMYWRAEWANGLVEERLVVFEAKGRIYDIVLVLEGEKAGKAMEIVRRYGVPVDSGESVNSCGRILTVDYRIGEGVLTMIKSMAGE